MKRFWIILLLFLLPLTAAADKMPTDVQALMEDHSHLSDPVDYLGFTTEGGQALGVFVTDGGFYIVENTADGWRFAVMSSVMHQLRPARLERIPGDVPAFHMTSPDNTTRLTYRYDGETFRLTGWNIPGYPPVTVDGEAFTYGEGISAVETILPGGLWSDRPWDASELPLTIGQIMAMATITEQNVRDMFPGYTLRDYLSGNSGREADAVYSRISDGTLYLRSVHLAAGMEPQITDRLPVRLSEDLLARLETEAFDDLIWCWLGGDTFRTQDAFSREAFPLPPGAVILQNRIEEHSLIVLAEVDGQRLLYVFEEGENPVRMTQPLPEGVYLDFFHAGDGDLQFEWDSQNMAASFTRRSDSRWLLSWCTCYGPDADVSYAANAFGVTYYNDDFDRRMRVGTLSGSDLFTVDFSSLDGAVPCLDQSGWAVVSNPDPADRLHLRTEPDRSARSLGKFYNGTPVQVLGKSGSWTKVQLGFGSTARTGWVMTRYLVFDADMNAVQPAFPDLIFRGEYAQVNQLGSGFMVAGVEETSQPAQYILLGEDGGVQYVPQNWLYPGNG